MKRNFTTYPVILLFAILALAVCRSGGLAKSPDYYIKMAEKENEKAISLSREGKCGQAVPHWERAYQFHPHSKFLYNIARCYENIANEVMAYEFYVKFLDKPPSESRYQSIIHRAKLKLAALSQRLAMSHSLVSIQTKPEKCFIYFDKNASHKLYTSPIKKWLRHGPHEIHIVKEGYTNLNKPFLVDKKQTMSLTFMLQNKRPSGFLTIASNVTGAKVYLNGEQRGITPVTRLEVVEGDFDLKIAHQGYELFKRTIRISKKKPVSIDALLKKSSPTLLGAGAQPAVQTEAEMSIQRIIAWSALGTGLVLTTTGAIFHGLALSKKDDADRMLPPQDPADSYVDRYENPYRGAYYEASTRLTVAVFFVMYGAGAASLAASIVFFILEPEKQTTEGAFTITPTTGPDFWGVNAAIGF